MQNALLLMPPPGTGLTTALSEYFPGHRSVYAQNQRVGFRLGHVPDQGAGGWFVNGSTHTVRLKIRYLDSGTETITVTYQDATPTEYTETVVTKTNTGKWLTAALTLAHVMRTGFGNYPDYNGADFLLSSAGVLVLNKVRAIDTALNMRATWSADDDAPDTLLHQPDIDDFTNAAHDHSTAAKGGGLVGTYNVLTYGAKGDGVTDSTAAIQSAFQAARAGKGGIVEFPPGVYVCSGIPDFTGAGNEGVTLRGVASTSQANAGCVLRYTGTTGPFLSFIGANQSIENLQIEYTNAGFTGTLINTACGGFRLQNVSLLGNGVSTALYLLSLNGSVDVTISDTLFQFSQYGLLGQAVNGTGYANAVQLRRCYFNNLTTGAIRNPGQGWDIQADFEQLQNHGGAAIVCDTGIRPSGIDLHGCWMGDATINSSYTWIQVQGYGWNIHGNFIHGTNPRTNAFGIVVKETTSGLSIVGNQIDAFTRSIDLGTGLASNAMISANDFSTSDTAIAGTPAGLALLQGVGGYPLYMYAAGASQFSVDGSGNVSTNGNLTTVAVNAYGGVAVKGGALTPSTPAGAAQTACHVYAGSGAPNNANGVDGDIYLRSDGDDSSTFYQRRSGAWGALRSLALAVVHNGDVVTHNDEIVYKG